MAKNQQQHSLKNENSGEPGGLRGLEHPLSKKRWTRYFHKYRKYLSIILKTKIGTSSEYLFAARTNELSGKGPLETSCACNIKLLLGNTEHPELTRGETTTGQRRG